MSSSLYVSLYAGLECFCSTPWCNCIGVPTSLLYSITIYVSLFLPSAVVSLYFPRCHLTRVTLISCVFSPCSVWGRFLFKRSANTEETHGRGRHLCYSSFSVSSLAPRKHVCLHLNGNIWWKAWNGGRERNGGRGRGWIAAVAMLHFKPPSYDPRHLFSFTIIEKTYSNSIQFNIGPGTNSMANKWNPDTFLFSPSVDSPT